MIEALTAARDGSAVLPPLSYVALTCKQMKQTADLQAKVLIGRGELWKGPFEVLQSRWPNAEEAMVPTVDSASALLQAKPLPRITIQIQDGLETTALASLAQHPSLSRLSVEFQPECCE